VKEPIPERAICYKEDMGRQVWEITVKGQEGVKLWKGIISKRHRRKQRFKEKLSLHYYRGPIMI
jgi:hypothetical protein